MGGSFYSVYLEDNSMFLGWKVAALVAVAGIASSAVSYSVGRNNGYDAGTKAATAVCDAYIKDWESKIIQMSNKHAIKVTELNEELDKLRNNAEQEAARLKSKIGDLRAKAKFASNPSCGLSDDELRQLQAAYTVRNSKGNSEG